MSARLISIILVIITAVSLTYAGYRLRGAAGPEQKPNVLIVSVCSLRHQLFKQFGGVDETTMTGVEKFFDEGAIVFTNMFNGIPWISLYEYMKVRSPAERVRELGYKLYSNNWQNYTFRIPRRERWKVNDTEIDDNSFEKNIAEDLEHLKSVIKTHRYGPFMMAAHVKYMHYPLIDRFNPDSEWDFYLSDAEKRRVAELIAAPEKFPEKLPLLVMLNNDGRGARKHPLIKDMPWMKKSSWERRARGLLTDPAIVALWKKGADFEDDLDILKKAYRGNARYLDKKLTPLLNLWGDHELRKNTLVVFTGDHGEAHMENGILGHGYSLRDEVLRVPLAARLPAAYSAPSRNEEQTDFLKFANKIDGYLDGHYLIAQAAEPAMLLRDCQNTQRGVRLNGAYKYIYDSASDQPYLYDLLADPTEKVNIAASHPDLVDRLERRFWALYDFYRPVHVGTCVPNPPAAE